MPSAGTPNSMEMTAALQLQVPKHRTYFGLFGARGFAGHHYLTVNGANPKPEATVGSPTGSMRL